MVVLMDHLWSPWRMKYITDHERGGMCVFCEAAKGEDGPANLIVHRGQTAFVILNRFPYTSGHLMVVPFVHQPSIELLGEETRAEMMELVNRSMGMIRAEYNPEAFNLGANIGEAAGAGIAAHVHMHIVPRWNGDTNFMSAIAGTRILPEDLEDTYLRLASRWINS
jgi:ATP adenylyltransferase